MWLYLGGLPAYHWSVSHNTGKAHGCHGNFVATQLTFYGQTLYLNNAAVKKSNYKEKHYSCLLFFQMFKVYYTLSYRQNKNVQVRIYLSLFNWSWFNRIRGCYWASKLHVSCLLSAATDRDRSYDQPEGGSACQTSHWPVMWKEVESKSNDHTTGGVSLWSAWLHIQCTTHMNMWHEHMTHQQWSTVQAADTVWTLVWRIPLD